MLHNPETALTNRDAIAQYEITPALVAQMAKDYLALTVVEGDTKSYKTVRAALTTCVRTRTGTDKRRKELGEGARRWISETAAAARQLLGPLVPVEEHLRGELTREDDRKAAIKAEKEAAERERVDDLRGMITEIQRIATEVVGKGSEEIRLRLEFVGNVNTTEAEFAEFWTEAAAVKEDALKALKRALADRLQLEKEEAERKAEAETLAKIAERQKVEDERLAAEKKALKDAKLAEEKRLEEERVALAAEKAEFEAEKQAEADRKAAEQKAIADAAEKAQREEVEALERAEAAEKEKAHQEALKPDKEKLMEWAQPVYDMCAYNLNIKDKGLKHLHDTAVRGLMSVYDNLKTSVELT